MSDTNHGIEKRKKLTLKRVVLMEITDELGDIVGGHHYESGSEKVSELFSAGASGAGSALGSAAASFTSGPSEASAAGGSAAVSGLASGWASKAFTAQVTHGGLICKDKKRAP